MRNSRAVFLIWGTLLCALPGAAQSSAGAQSSSDKNPDVIKVGVALLKNTATRSVPVMIERDHLVSAINRVKPPKHSKDSVKIQAVGLDSSSAAGANEQARDLGCDYVVFTQLTELRESGDPAPAPRPGEVRIGRDPVAGDPTVDVRHDVQRYAVVEFQLFRLGDPNPRFDTSASAHEPTTEEGIVSLLMDQVASRVVGEIRGNKTRPAAQ
ncbi:MAG TPA: hypothetical protein VK473_09350 [Terriglobales bacterium]|nr:hypothetical protein [Terriglobales bacterium]